MGNIEFITHGELVFQGNRQSGAFIFVGNGIMNPMENSNEALQSLIADMAGSLSREGVTASWVEKERQEAARALVPKTQLQEKWTSKEWTAEMFASIRAKDLERLNASLRAGADVKAKAGQEHRRETALMVAVGKKWTQGIARLVSAGAPLRDSKQAGAWSLLSHCAEKDYIDGARVLWDLHSQDEQKAASERFNTFEGFEFLCSKGMESDFESYKLMRIGQSELSKKPISTMDLDKLGRIFKSSALMDYGKGNLWRFLIELDDPKLFDHAGRNGWAPRPDGSCLIAEYGGGKHGVEEKSFCELLIGALRNQWGYNSEWRLGREMLKSSTFREALEKDAPSMASLAGWIGHEVSFLKMLADSGLAMDKMVSNIGRNPLHSFFDDQGNLYKDQEFIGVKTLEDLLKMCPDWTSQKDEDGLTPFGLFVAANPGREADVSQIEAMILSVEVKTKRGKKPKAKRL